MTVESKTFGQHARQRSLALPGLRAAAARAAERPKPLQREARKPVPGIRTNEATPPVAIPPGHIGPVVLPGTGRLVYWTGRVAIGLRHEPRPHVQSVPHSTLWVQDLMLGEDLGLAY